MTFTASNGVQVIPVSKGLTFALPGSATPSPWGINQEKVDALREFFQHEKDEQLGRWRSIKHPDWTAIRKNTTVYFQCEDHERSFHFVVGNEGTLRAWSTDLQEIGWEYIDAHPEPKPWHEAKHGEVWELVLKFDERPLDTRAAVFHDHDRYGNANFWFTDTNTYIPKASAEIIAARRIYPEDPS